MIIIIIIIIILIIIILAITITVIPSKFDCLVYEMLLIRGLFQYV